MLETTVTDSAKKFGLQKEVAETSGVDADVAALLVDGAAGSELAFLSIGGGGGGLVGPNLLVGVINEILFVRHSGQPMYGLLEVRKKI